MGRDRNSLKEIEASDSVVFVKVVGYLCILYGAWKLLGAALSFAIAYMEWPLSALFVAPKAIWAAVILALGYGCVKFHHWARPILIAITLRAVFIRSGAFFLFFIDPNVMKEYQAMYASGSGATRSYIAPFVAAMLLATAAILLVMTLRLLTRSAEAAFWHQRPEADWSDQFQIAPLIVLTWLLVSACSLMAGIPILGLALGQWSLIGLWKVASFVGALVIAWLILSQNRHVWWALIAGGIATTIQSSLPVHIQHFDSFVRLLQQRINSTPLNPKYHELISKTFASLREFLQDPIIRALDILRGIAFLIFLIISRKQFSIHEPRKSPFSPD